MEQGLRQLSADEDSLADADVTQFYVKYPGGFFTIS